ncbi:DUF6170 family protein [Neptunicella marina]|uniref:DUF6170 family protein n=1 Tax=Neptunicella marina TaxID=2125989 RepID=UPI001F5111F2|nr:DUF6170 family protein [Neptunicella marina]
MRLIFSSKQISSIQHLPLTTRIELLHKAVKHLTTPEKMLLNLFKLAILIPVFTLLLRVSQDWSALIWIALLLLCFPLLVKPLQYGLSEKYLSNILARET